jgi:DnaJ-class molecular chaperone
MKKEIPIEQRKGVFTRCKDCKGYGYKRFHISWSTNMYSIIKPVERTFKCETCNGTGRLTWIDKMIGR